MIKKTLSPLEKQNKLTHNPYNLISISHFQSNMSDFLSSDKHSVYVFENGVLEGESRQAGRQASRQAGRQASRRAGKYELTDYPHRDRMLLWMRF